MKKPLYLILVLISLIVGCQSEPPSPKNIDTIRNEFFNGTKVMVAAHRGYWREAPENSLEAIKAAINLGVDIVEIDVRLTKDSVPVLMHDNTLDRTTGIQGQVFDFNLDSIQTTGLRNGLGRITQYKVPTLEEAMLLAKGKVMINLDKCYDIFPVIYPVLQKTGTLDHVIMKGSKQYPEVAAEMNAYLDEVIYMPVINLDKEESIHVFNEFRENHNLKAVEFIFSNESSPLIKDMLSIRDAGIRVWVNSLWDELCAGHSDDFARENPGASWGWLIKSGTNIVQTDRPKSLLNYLNNE